MWARNRNFRLFFSGQLISFLGDWFTTIALYTAVAELSRSAFALTLVVVCKTLPVFVIAPFAGPLVDRVDRRRLLLASDLGRAALAIAFIGFHALGSLSAIYLCAIATTLLSGLAIPAKQAVLPRIVSSKDYAAANAMGGASWAGMLAVGAALGGTVTALVGVDVSFVIDSATFLLSAAFFFRLPAQHPPGAKEESTGFGDALCYLRAHPELAAQASIKSCQFLAGGVFALIPVFGGGLFKGYDGALWLGILYALRGLGTFIGSLWFRVLLGERLSKMRVSVVLAFVAQGAVYWLLARSTTYAQACLFYGISGLLQGLVWVFAGTLLQAGVDSRFHGRIFAMEFGGLTLTLALSSMLSGALVDSGFSPQAVVLMMAPLPLVGALVALYVSLASR